MIVVLDASVVLKWLLEDPAREPDTEKALAVIESVIRIGLEILQRYIGWRSGGGGCPPHPDSFNLDEAGLRPSLAKAWTNDA